MQKTRGKVFKYRFIGHHTHFRRREYDVGAEECDRLRLIAWLGSWNAHRKQQQSRFCLRNSHERKHGLVCHFEYLSTRPASRWRKLQSTNPPSAHQRSYTKFRMKFKAVTRTNDQNKSIPKQATNTPYDVTQRWSIRITNDRFHEPPPDSSAHPSKPNQTTRVSNRKTTLPSSINRSQQAKKIDHFIVYRCPLPLIDVHDDRDYLLPDEHG